MWRTVVPEWPQLIALALPASNQSQPPARHEISEVMAITSDVRGIKGEGAGAQKAGSGKAKGRGGTGQGEQEVVALKWKQRLLDSMCLPVSQAQATC